MTPQPSKRKRKKEPSSNQFSADIVLLADSFKEATTILADAYCASHTLAKPRKSEFPRQKTIKKRMDKLEANIQSMVEKALQSPPTTQALENKLDQMKTEIKERVERVLQAFAGLNAAGGLGPPTR